MESLSSGEEVKQGVSYVLEGGTGTNDSGRGGVVVVGETLRICMEHTDSDKYSPEGVEVPDLIPRTVP